MGAGIVPMEYKVLLKPDTVEETTEGGIVLARSVVHNEQNAQVDATVIALGPMAFEDWPASARRPQAGDRVMFAKYAGIYTTGADGEQYRIVNDKDLLAFRTEEVKRGN